jgi:hypothetical protein
MRNASRMLVAKPEGKRPLGRTKRRWEMMKWISEKCGVNCGLDSFGSGQGPVAACRDHGNEPSGYIRGGEFHD